jgi:hypothetical protein
MMRKGNILIAEEGKLIMHINQLCANKEIALGKEANYSDWVEIDETQWDFENDKFIE